MSVGGSDLVRQLRRAVRERVEAGAPLVFDAFSALLGNIEALTLLRDGHVQVRAKDLPWLTEDHLPSLIGAALAQREHRSALIKKGLAAARARGVHLGNPLLHDMHAAGLFIHLPRARERAMAANRSGAQAFAEKLRAEVMRYLRASPDLTYQALADRMNRDGVPTRRGGRWNPGSVYRLCVRLGIRTSVGPAVPATESQGEFS